MVISFSLIPIKPSNGKVRAFIKRTVVPELKYALGQRKPLLEKTERKISELKTDMGNLLSDAGIYISAECKGRSIAVTAGDTVAIISYDYLGNKGDALIICPYFSTEFDREAYAYYIPSKDEIIINAHALAAKGIVGSKTQDGVAYEVGRELYAKTISEVAKDILLHTLENGEIEINPRLLESMLIHEARHRIDIHARALQTEGLREATAMLSAVAHAQDPYIGLAKILVTHSIKEGEHGVAARLILPELLGYAAIHKCIDPKAPFEEKIRKFAKLDHSMIKQIAEATLKRVYSIAYCVKIPSYQPF